MDVKAIRRAIGATASSLAVAAAILTGSAAPALADPASAEELPLYYLENPNTGEGFFTTDRNERNVLDGIGWNYEWVALYVPSESAQPVYRLYNPNNDDHLFTLDENEYNTLPTLGWVQEGVKFHSADSSGTPMYRLYIPYITTAGAHIYSTDYTWANSQSWKGWQFEGAKWWGTRGKDSMSEAERYQGRFGYPDIDPSAADPMPPEQNEPQDPVEDVVAPGDGHPEVLAYAREWVGWPYVSSGESPEEGGFDCSGLTWWVYRHFGVDLPRTTWEQIQWLKDHGTWTSDVGQLKPGDIVAMSGGGHVALFVGMDPVTGRYMMIDAPSPGRAVQERELYSLYYGGFMGGGSVL